MFGVELDPFFGVEGKVLQFLELPGEEFALAGGGGGIELCIASQFADALPFAPAGGDSGAKWRGTGMRVQQLPLGVCAQQGMMGMLPVNVGEPVPGDPQLCQRHRNTVDPGFATSIRVDHPAQNHGVVVRWQLLLVKPVRKPPSRRQAKLGDDVRLGLAHAHHAAVGATAERKPERIEQDGFARTGLAGQGTKARAELELETIDNDEITNSQAAQHGLAFRLVELSRAGQLIIRTGQLCRGAALQCSFSRSIAK